MDSTTGILLLNLGGPRNLAEVEPFLRRLFADRDLIHLPGGPAFQGLFARLIAQVRSPTVQRRYKLIGGGSPILRFTQAQGVGLAALLDVRHPLTAPHRPYIAFRYTPPFVHEALRHMAADGVRRVVALSLYPQYSAATTGSSLRDLERALDQLQLRSQFEIHVVKQWADHPGYLDALAHTVRRGREAYPPEHRHQVTLLFSAHGLPMSLVDAGDPYPAQINATVAGVLSRLIPTPPHRLGFQSRTGPVRWLAPGTDQVLRELAQEGIGNVLVIPVSFVSDHIETLYELDIELAHLARRLGITGYQRAPALNDQPVFLEALASLVVEALEGT